MPLGSTLNGKGTIDRLTGQAGDDIFLLGRAGQRFYDGDGTAGLAVITDFQVGFDRIQLPGAATHYTLSSGRYSGVNGTFISVASGGERIGFVEGLRSTGLQALQLNDDQQFIYV